MGFTFVAYSVGIWISECHVVCVVTCLVCSCLMLCWTVLWEARIFWYFLNYSLQSAVQAVAGFRVTTHENRALIWRILFLGYVSENSCATKLHWIFWFLINLHYRCIWSFYRQITLVGQLWNFWGTDFFFSEILGKRCLISGIYWYYQGC